LLNTLKQYTVK